MKYDKNGNPIIESQTRTEKETDQRKAQTKTNQRKRERKMRECVIRKKKEKGERRRINLKEKNTENYTRETQMRYFLFFPTCVNYLHVDFDLCIVHDLNEIQITNIC